MTSFPSGSEVAQMLASLALNEAGVPDPIGALILGAVFESGDSVPPYFQQVFAEIQAIVSQAITQNQIDIINGQIQGTVNYVTTTYGALKSAGTPPAQLLADIIPYVTNMNLNVVETLQEDQYNQVGFGAFLAAAPIYLSLVQEQALNDPNVSNPWSSGYCQAVASNAQAFATFATTNWAAVKAARSGQIVVKSTYGPTSADAVTPEAAMAGAGSGAGESAGAGAGAGEDPRRADSFPPPPPYICYYWQDSSNGNTGNQYCGYGWPGAPNQEDNLNQAKADCAAQQAQVVAALTTALGDPDTLIATWLQIAAKPLPVPKPS